MKPLGEIVIEEGLASPAAVERAADAADRDRVPLIVALVREARLDELALVAAIRRHVRIALLDPATIAPDADAVRQLPREVARRLRVLPLQLVTQGARRAFRLAMADPTDTVAVAEVEHHTGCQVEPKLLPLSTVEELVERSYRHVVTEVMNREPSEPEAEGAGEARPGGRRKRRAATGVGGTVPRLAKPEPIEPAAPEITARITIDELRQREPRPAPSVTLPHHRPSEPDLALRHRALIDLLVKKHLLSEEEYEAEVRALRQRRDEG